MSIKNFEYGDGVTISSKWQGIAIHLGDEQPPVFVDDRLDESELREYVAAPREREVFALRLRRIADALTDRSDTNFAPRD